MNILVTGGAGYLGSVLVPYLLNEKHNVTVIDNFMYGQTSLLDCCNSDLFEIINGDIRDESLMKEIVKGKDIIIPLACLTGAPICSKKPKAAKEIIVDAIDLMISNMNAEQKIIYPSTNSGYGVGQEELYCTEKSELKPVSLYGKYKNEAEKKILKKQNSISLRLATVFGMSPRMRTDLLVNNFVYRAVNDKFIVLFESHFKRNYIHVRDVANVFIHCINNFEKMKNEIYNVGLSNANLSKWELCEEIKKQIPDFYFVEAEIGEDPDRRNYIVSNEKIEKTGWKPKFSLQQGIKELIKGYKIIKNKEFSNV